MLTIALSFAVLDLTGSVSDLGLVLAVSRLPLVLTVLAGGVLADRLPRRSVMVASDLVRLATQGVTAALLLAGRAQLWELLVLQAAAGTAAGFFYPAQSGIWPLTLPPPFSRRGTACAASPTRRGRCSVRRAGGLLVVASSPGWALAVDAATFRRECVVAGAPAPADARAAPAPALPARSPRRVASSGRSAGSGCRCS
jgi:MFS family permease